MAHPKAKITQSELTRYLKAFRDAGIPVARAEIGRDGKVVVISTDDPKATVVNEWDDT